MEAAMDMARKIVPNSAFSIRLIKKGIDMAPEVSLDALMNYEIEACLATVSSPERQKALEDFQTRKVKTE
jgi:enoyl-CoA hydratase